MVEDYEQFESVDFFCQEVDKYIEVILNVKKSLLEVGLKLVSKSYFI